MTLRCDFGPSTALLIIYMIKSLITTFFQTGYSQRKVNVAFVNTTKDAFQKSTQFKDTFIIFSRTVQFCYVGSYSQKQCSPLKSFLRLPTSFFFIYHFTIRAQSFPDVLRLCIALQFYNPLRSRLYVLRLGIALRRLVEMRRSEQASIFFKLVSVAMVTFFIRSS